MLPLPGGFRLRQHVVALYELLLNSDMKVPLGSVGHVIGSLGEDRITVLFESLSRPAATPGEVHQSVPEYPVSVNIREVAAKRPLVGGFSIAQKVQACMSLVVGSRVVVHRTRSAVQHVVQHGGLVKVMCPKSLSVTFEKTALVAVWPTQNDDLCR